MAASVIEDLSYHLPCSVDDVLLGNVTGPGGNIARLSSLESSGVEFSSGVTIDRQCGSGLEAIRLACHLIQGGAGEAFIAGGVESASQSPYKKRAVFSPLSIGDPDMGKAADNTAKKYYITREEQDRYALLSYQRALCSYKKGYFEKELIDNTDFPRKDESINLKIDISRMLNRLTPCFTKDGTVTLGNCCGVNDGASAVVVMSEEIARKWGYQPVLKFIDSAVVPVDPNYPIAGALSAITKILDKCNLTVEQIDQIELNEAFAAKAVLVSRELSIPYKKLNVQGGAISLGHPYGASGAILVTRLFHSVKRCATKYSLSVIGMGGGIGIAVLWES